MILLGKDLLAIGSIRQKPYIRYRGLRYNIPLDARTPIMMTLVMQHRKTLKPCGNGISGNSIWSLHPYPSWIRVPDYPEVALENEYSPCNLDIVITRQKDYQR